MTFNEIMKAIEALKKTHPDIENYHFMFSSTSYDGPDREVTMVEVVTADKDLNQWVKEGDRYVLLS